jgi:adenine deaminase
VGQRPGFFDHWLPLCHRLGTGRDRHRKLDDHHNIVAIGADDKSMLTAARVVGEIGGGFVAANGDQVLASLPLPIAGLMSDLPVEAVRDAMDALLINSAALGSAQHDPFMVMGFMALEVIPALKLTDQGLVDVEQFKPVELFVEE